MKRVGVCEDINEVSSDTDDNHGYCTDPPWEQEKEDPNDDQNTIVDETPYEEMGHGLAMATVDEAGIAELQVH